MIQLCLRWKITAWSAKDAFIVAMSSMPNQAAKAAAAMNGTQTKPAFCSHSVRVTPLQRGLRLAAERSRTRPR